jgi:adenine-specific DNA-methyltransferase
MDNKELLKNYLRDIFQFDFSELDFGIYRIMNYKRKEIKNFIENDLINAVEEEFKKYKTINQKELIKKLEEKKLEIKKIEKELGEQILKNDTIDPKFKDKPVAKEYEKLINQMEQIDVAEEIQNQVFNDLYNFFSRYYEDGDFISKRRYGRFDKYAIPYNGEEVKLYWANYDQYYIKTGEIFKNYEFESRDYRFIFKTTVIDVPVGNVKNDKRYFFLAENEPVKIEDKTITINFEYRPLKDSIKQEMLNESIKEKILEKIKNNYIKGILCEIEKEQKGEDEKDEKDEKNNNKTFLDKHIFKFTKKITSDFFIHKDLKGFLERELDYFIKTEVIDIENLDTEKEIHFDKHITRAKVVKNIGKKIIEFLAQIEDFQKMLWEKKKFVLRTEYVITTDRIPDEFYDEIVENKEQLKEWEELGLGKIKTKKDLIDKKLPVDTKYFSPEFKEKLLEKITEKDNLDDLLDGVLIKSENWQALNLLLEKYREKVQCIYIDPPYNTGSDGFLYNDKYKHSSWLAMIENRLVKSKDFINYDGVIFISIDDREQENLKILLKNIYGDEKFLSQIIRNIPDGANLKTIGGIKTSTEYVISFFKDNEPNVNNFLFEDSIYKEITQNNLEKFIETRLTKRGNPQSEILFPKGIGVKKNGLDLKLKQGNYINPSSREKILIKKGDLNIKNGILQEDVILEASWCMPNILKKLFSGEIVFDDSGQKYEYVFFKNNGIPYIIKSRNKTLIPSYFEIKSKTDELFIDFFGFDESPRGATIKPIELIYILIAFYTFTDDIILDFFAGSGTTAHAIMRLNKEDGGKRKFILVEMADYFDTIIIPRMKKIAYSFNWKDGKPQDEDGIGVFFKYQYLEQYEDTLHNIEFSKEEKAAMLFENLDEDAKSEYLMKYMLKFETEGSASLLDIKKFEKPFEYKLKIKYSGKREEIVNVDLVETFNYLIGLKVNKYKFLKENKRKYVFVFGERAGKKTVVVWRETKNLNIKEDKDIIESNLKHFNYDEIYINGDNAINNAKLIESEFKALMGV